MNKAELVAKLAERTGASKSGAENCLNTLTDIIKEEVANGEKIQLIGFGTFETRERAARTGRNPQTGEEIKIKASKAPAFKAGKAFKDIVNK